MGDEVRGLWRELRRRRVVSTAAAYAAVAFVALQLAEILFPAFALGPDALRALFALLLAGFPVVLALSWVFDVTLSGLHRTTPSAPEDGDGRAVPSRIVLGLVLASSVALGAVGWWAVSVAEAPIGSPSSIAVLPFEDMSASQDQAYLGDGLAEEVLNILAGVEGLQVAARTSSFAFRNSEEDVRAIGERLNVSKMLEGSVRKEGSRVRVTAQLIDTQTGFHDWSETYDAELDDLFAVQDSIASAIVEELLGRLEAPGTRATRHEPSPAAQDAYWRGRAQWNRRDASGIPRAVGLFEEALRIDSLFPEAYAGLADSYALLPQFVSTTSPEDAWTNAERLARRAIALDPNLAEAHASLGLVRALRRDRRGALESLGRAIELNPSYAPALHWRANVLAEAGSLDAALEDAERAARLDALSPAIATDHAYIRFWRGDVAGAKDEFERALLLEFGFREALFGRALVALREREEVALTMTLAQWAAVSGAPPTLAGALGPAMLARAETGVAAPVPDALATLAPRPGGLDSGSIAALHALIGSREGMVEWLRRAVSDGSWVNQYLRVNPVYAGYRADPDFLDLVGAIID